VEFEIVGKKGSVIWKEDNTAVGVARDEYSSYILRYGKGPSRFSVVSASFRKGRVSKAGITLSMENGAVSIMSTLSATATTTHVTELALLDIPFYAYEKLVQSQCVKI